MGIKTYTWVFLILLVGWFSLTARAVSPSPNEEPTTEADVYVHEVIAIPVKQLKQPSPDILCSCVSYAKYLLGVHGETWGAARSIKVNSTEPDAGSLILTRESINGHVGVVLNYDSKEVTFRESNYISCKAGVRTLRRDDPVIRGYNNLK